MKLSESWAWKTGWLEVDSDRPWPSDPRFEEEEEEGVNKEAGGLLTGDNIRLTGCMNSRLNHMKGGPA